MTGERQRQRSQPGYVISTEGALRLPSTYDNHLIPYVHPHVGLWRRPLHCRSSLINLQRAPTTSNDYLWLLMTTDDYQWLQMTTVDYRWLPMTTDDYPMTLWWLSDDCPLTIQWLFDDYPMSIRWLSHDFPMSVSHAYPITIPWLSHDYPLTIHWLANDQPMTIMNFWSIFLDDHWSKKISRPKMIV